MKCSQLSSCILLCLVIFQASALYGIQVKDRVNAQYTERDTIGTVALRARSGKYLFASRYNTVLVNEMSGVNRDERFLCVLWEEGGFITGTKTRLKCLESQNKVLEDKVERLEEKLEYLLSFFADLPILE